jgi:hypothetical protein
MKKIYAAVFYSVVLALSISTCTAQITSYSRSAISGQVYTPISGGTIINTTAQLSPGQTRNGDDGTVLVTLPFSFNYNGASYTQVTFCTNGWLALGDQTTTVSTTQSWSALNMFSTSLPNNTIGPWYKDGNGNFPSPYGNGSMVHGPAGTDVYGFEWRNAASSGYSLTLVNNMNFMVLLYGPASAYPGRIEFLYGSQSGSFSANAGIGIEDGTGGTGHYINALNGQSNSTSYSTAWPGNGNGFRFDPPQQCTGTPAGGATNTSNGSVCSGASFILDVQGSTTGSGLTYQWQSSATGTTWTDIANATNITYNNTQGITATTWYRRSISCGSNVSYSSPLQVNVNSASLCYCSPLNGTSLHSSVGSPNIEKVVINGTTLNNAHAGAAVNGYTQFAASGSTTASLQQGVTYTLSATLTGNGDASVWIDWNRNGLYEATEWSRVALANSSGTINVAVPPNAPIGTTGMRIRSRSSGSGNNATDGCSTFGSGETEEYIITIIAGQPCTGTPVAGTITAPTQACAGNSFTLSVGGYTATSGIGFQWQSSPAGQNAWANIAGATTNTASVTQADVTDYRVMVTCNGSNAAYSDTATVAMRTTNCPTVNDDPCSAIPLMLSPDGNCVNGVPATTMGATTSTGFGYTNPVGCNSSYSPKDVWFRVTTPASGPGSTAINFKLIKPSSSTMTTANMTLFAASGNCPAPVLTYVTNACNSIPSGWTWNSIALNVTTLSPNTTYYLRVSPYSSYDSTGAFEMCAYIPPQPCTGVPNGGNTVSNTPTVCAGKPFTVSVSNGAMSTGLTYQWQVSTNGSSWTNASQQTAESYYVSSGINAPAYYRRRVKCGTDSAFSVPLQVTMSAPAMCYCNSTNGTILHSVTSSPSIVSVAIAGTSLSNNHTATATGGYTMFPASGSTTATLQQGGSYSLVTGMSAAGIASVWVDWNANGVYESNEWKQITTNSTGGTTVLTVPATGATGNIGMRIRSRSTGNVNGSTDACSNFASGETEEYIITIATATPCTGTPTGGNIYGPVEVCAGKNFTLNAAGYTVATGIDLQWQSSAAGPNTWTNISGANGPSLTTSQLAATDYRVMVACNGSNAVAGTTLAVGMSTQNCPPVNDEPCNATTLLVSADDNCANKLTGTTTLATTSTGYGYSNPVGCGYGYTPKDVWYKVTTAASGAGSTNLFFKLTRPTGSNMSSATMTLFAMTGSCPSSTLAYVASACKNSSYGFTPYTMLAYNLTPSTTYYLRVNPCADYDPTGTFEVCAYVPPPTPSCVTYVTPTSNAVVPLNQNIVFEWTSASGATSYDHYLGTTNPPTTLFKSTTATKDSTKFTTYNTKYYWYVAPRNNGGSAAGCVIDSFVTAGPAANCVPVFTYGCNSGDAIKLFTLTGESSTAINQSSACSPNAYANYTATTTATLLTGHAYTGSFWVSDSKDHASIWIDFNDDGFFTANERVLSNLRAMGTTAPTTFTINIPAAATAGNHKLRIRSVYYSTSPVSATDACSNYMWGETEDYTVNVVAPQGPVASAVARGSNNGCTSLGSLTINDNSNNSSRWIDIVDDANDVVASINASGNDLGIIDAKLYKNNGSIRIANGVKLLDRNISIVPEFEPQSPVTVRLYFSDAELTALKNADPSVASRASLNVTKTEQGCEAFGPLPVDGLFVPQSANGASGTGHYIDIVVESLSNFYIHGSVALPVTVYSFSGQRLGSINKLTWKTSTEVNNAGFELLRSTDGNSYSTLTFVPSAATNGNSTAILNYSFNDERPLAGTGYYRLRQVDKDGKATYSNIVVIKGDKVNGLMITSLYPNPGRDNVTLALTSPTNDRVQVIVTDVAGKVVMQQQANVTAGDNTLKLDVQSLHGGTYFVKLTCTTGCESTVMKLMKE